MKLSHYTHSLEWVYKDIKPRIVVERFITPDKGSVPDDYKVFCFNGKPKLIYVAKERGSGNVKFDFYDIDWNYLDIENAHSNSGKLTEKPDKLPQMLEYAAILSEGFPHVRIDFYIENNKIIFGECTFFHMAGMEAFEPEKWDYKLGEMLTLPEKKNQRRI